MQKMIRAGLLSLFATTSLFAADSYTWGNVAFEGGGFVDGIVTSKTQPGLVYARTDVGGAYRWDSVGGKWIPLMDWVNEADRGLFGVEALALDPNDPAKVYILAGMEYFSKGKTMILRSSDYGNTFDTVNVTAQFQAHGNGMGRNTGEKLAVDPTNGAILYCGTRTKGLFRSADSGKTWAAVAGTTTLSGSGLVNDNGISYVVFDPTSGTANGGTKTVFVGVSNGSGSLYKSTDGGVSFSKVTGAPAQMAMRAVFADGTLYGTFSAGPGPHSQNGGSVWKLAIATGTWTNITPKADSGWVYATGHEGYGYGFGGVTVDPKNPLRVVVTTLGCYGATNLWLDGKGNAGDVVFLSNDGGATWKATNAKDQNIVKANLDPNGNNWISGSSIHWAGTIEFDPFDTKKVWVGSGNGVFRTEDVNAAVPLWKFQSRGIEETVPLDLVSIPGGPIVTAIMDYDGATYQDILVSSPVHQRPIGSSTSLGYAAQVGGFIRSGRITDYSTSPAVTFDAMYMSLDSGRTWSLTDTSSIIGSSGMHAMSADGKVLLIRPGNLKNGKGANSATFYRSTDAGKTWAPVTGISSDKGKMVSDPVNPLKFYIMPDGYTGDLLGSDDGGKTFTKISSLKNPNFNQSPASSGMLRAAPGVEGDLWLCLDAEQPWNASGYSAHGLAHSTDGGKTWSYLNTMDGCLTMGLGKAAPGKDYYALYMWGAANGLPRGIYRSIDKGLTWERINDDKHQFGGPANGTFVVGDFNVYGRVYMSTAGRGIVYGNIGTLVSTGVRNPKASARMIQVGWSQMGNAVTVQSYGLHGARLEVRDIKGNLVLHENIQDGQHQVSLEKLSRGNYVAMVVASEGNTFARRLTVK